MSSNDELAAPSVGFGNGGGGNGGGARNKCRLQVSVPKGLDAILKNEENEISVECVVESDGLADAGFPRGTTVVYKMTDKDQIKKATGEKGYVFKPDEIKGTFEKGAIHTLEDVVVDGTGLKASYVEFFSAPPIEVTTTAGKKIKDLVPLFSEYLRVGKAQPNKQKVSVYKVDQALAMSGPDGAKSDLAAYLQTLVPHAKAQAEANPSLKQLVDSWLELVEEFDGLSGLEQIETIVDGWRYDPAIQDAIPETHYAAVIRAINSQTDLDAPNAILAAELFVGSMAYPDPEDTNPDESKRKRLFRQALFSEMVETTFNMALSDKLNRAPSAEEKIQYADMLNGNVKAVLEAVKEEKEIGEGENKRTVATYGNANATQLANFLIYLDATALKNEQTRVWEVIPVLQPLVMGDSLKARGNVQHSAPFRPAVERTDRDGKHYQDSIIMKGSLLAWARRNKRTQQFPGSYQLTKLVGEKVFAPLFKHEIAAPEGPTFKADSLPSRTTDALGQTEKLVEAGRKRTKDNYDRRNWSKGQSNNNDNQQEGKEHSAPPSPGR